MWAINLITRAAQSKLNPHLIYLMIQFSLYFYKRSATSLSTCNIYVIVLKTRLYFGPLAPTPKINVHLYKCFDCLIALLRNFDEKLGFALGKQTVDILWIRIVFEECQYLLKYLNMNLNRFTIAYVCTYLLISLSFSKLSHTYVDDINSIWSFY